MEKFNTRHHSLSLSQPKPNWSKPKPTNTKWESKRQMERSACHLIRLLAHTRTRICSPDDMKISEFLPCLEAVACASLAHCLFAIVWDFRSLFFSLSHVEYMLSFNILAAFIWHVSHFHLSLFLDFAQMLWPVSQISSTQLRFGILC